MRTSASAERSSAVMAEDAARELNAILLPYMNEGTAPEQLPTAETIGLMWSFLETLETEALELGRLAKQLKEDLGQTDALRLDEALRRAR